MSQSTQCIGSAVLLAMFSMYCCRHVWRGLWFVLGAQKHHAALLHCFTPVSSTVVVEACGDDYGFSLCSIVSISGPIFNKQDAQGDSNHLCPNADKENIMAGKEMHQKDIC